MITDAQAAHLLATLIDPSESWEVDDAADDHGGYGIKASAGGHVVLIDGYETDANHASNLAVIAAAPDALRTVVAQAEEIADLRLAASAYIEARDLARSDGEDTIGLDALLEALRCVVNGDLGA